MAKYDKKAALKIMIEAVKQYEEKLNDKQFLIIYREGKDIKTVNVGFRDMNFLHMTGVKTRLSAQQFYVACWNQNFLSMILKLIIKEKCNRN